MNKHLLLLIGVLFTTIFGSFSPELFAREKAPPPEKLRIGIVSSLFRDVPEPMVMTLMAPFGGLMEAQTGVNGQLLPGGNALILGRKLVEDKLDLGIFQGVEFAWAKDRFPQLRPLAIVINQYDHLHAFLVVRSGSNIHGFGDLQGKELAMPMRSHEHCFLFLDHYCRSATGHDAEHLLARMTRPANAEDALDDLIDGRVQAAIIEEVALERYKHRKPGRSYQLKVLQESETFPASVVAYRAGALDEETVTRLREGLLQADKVPMGRQLLSLWMVTGFEPIPADFSETLTNILKDYPPPGR